MSISSLSKIFHYLNCVTTGETRVIEYEGTVYLTPVDQVVISPGMWYKDWCECCGQCCRNYNTVFSMNEYNYILENVFTESHRELVHKSEQRSFKLDGVEKLFYEVPPMTSKDSHGIYTKGDKTLNCRWVYLSPDDKKLCRIHEYRTITCGFPHMEFRRQKDSNIGHIGHLQFGRNHQLGCPVNIKAEPYDEATKQDDLYWLNRLNDFANEYGIKTLLPRVIDCVEKTHLTDLPTSPIIISARKRLF